MTCPEAWPLIKLLGPDICRWGWGVFHMKGWGPKSSVCPSKLRENKLFGRISWILTGIFGGGCPKNRKLVLYFLAPENALRSRHQISICSMALGTSPLSGSSFPKCLRKKSLCSILGPYPRLQVHTSDVPWPHWVPSSSFRTKSLCALPKCQEQDRLSSLQIPSPPVLIDTLRGHADADDAGSAASSGLGSTRTLHFIPSLLACPKKLQIYSRN